MVCRRIRLLIGWLLVTSSSVHCNITRPTTDTLQFFETAPTGQNEASTSKDPTGLQQKVSPTMDYYDYSTTPSTANDIDDDDDAAESKISTPAEEEHGTGASNNDNDNDSDNSNSTSAPPPPPPTTLPAHLRGEGLLSSEDYERMTYVLNCVVVPVIAVGLLTNVVAIVVFRRMPASVTSTFFSLSTVLDAGYLLAGLPQTLTYLVLGEGRAMQDLFYLGCGIYFSNYVTHTLRKVIVCVTMLLSLDRYLMVAFPVRMITLDHHRRPKLYTLIVTVMAFLLDINVLFRFKVVQASSFQNGTESTVVYLQTTEAYNARRQMFHDIALTSSFIFLYTPLLLLVLFNTLLVVSLVRHSRDLKSKFVGIFQKNEATSSGSGGGGSTDQMSEIRTVTTSLDSRGNTGTADEPPSPRGHNQGDSRGSLSQGGQVNSRSTVETAGNVTSGRVRVKKSLMSRPTEQQNSITVLVYSFVFILLSVPSAMYPLLRKVVPGYSIFRRQHFLVLALSNVYFLLHTISSSMNFFIYFTIGSSFRAGVLRLFARRRVD